MENSVVDKVYRISEDRIADASLDFKCYLYEAGGKGKGFDQIADIPDSFVVNDDVEVGRGNKIPLWLFGFLY